MDINLLETEVTVGDHKYRVGRMSVFEQMNVCAELRDILIGLAMVKSNRPEKMSNEENNKTIQYVMASRGGLSSEARIKVMSACLGKVLRNSGRGWAPVLASEGSMQFEDISLPQIYMLVYAVFEHNKLIDFFSESPLGSDGQAETKESGQHSRMEKTGS